MNIRHAGAFAAMIAVGFASYQLLTQLTGELGQVWLLVVAWTIAVTGLNIVQGLAGYPSLAQASFFGGGAYLSTIFLERGMSMLMAAVAAVALVGAGGLVLGLVFARTRGQYFAIGTLFFAAVFTVVVNTEDELTGGPQGRPVGLGWEPDTTLALLAITMTVGFAIFYAISRLRLGSRLLSIREDEDLAEHLGVPTASTKLMAVVLSALFGGWAGVLLAQYNGVVAPSQFTYVQGFLMFVALGLGGNGRLFAPLLGSAIVVGMPQLLNIDPVLSQMLVGVVFVVVTLALPEGLIGGLSAGFSALLGRVPSAKGTRVKAVIDA